MMYAPLTQQMVHLGRFGVLAVLLVISALLLPAVASAVTKSELDAAKERMAQINDEISAQQSALDSLSADIDAQAGRVSQAEGQLEQVRGQVASTKGRLQEAQVKYDALQAKLNERAAVMYMQGSPGSIGVLLGSESMAELADRLTYANAVTSSDIDLGTEVQNLGNELEVQLRDQRRLLDEQAAALQGLQRQLSQLNDRWAQEKALAADIASKRHEAEQLVAGLQKKYQQELAQQIPPAPMTPGSSGGSGATTGSNPLQVCPVGSPHAVSDGFGAPRYGGGYHLHLGNDILAPSGTPIYATFSGTVYDTSNSLGGIAVKVIGSQGWTYNAHMSSIARLGSVSAGEVIGYVGATGDTSTPHDHFEWHPNVLPSSWPSSPYGYNVIDDAANPYPILAAVC